MNDNNEYEKTINYSMEASISQAKLILEESLNKCSKIKRPKINTKRIICRIIFTGMIKIFIMIKAIHMYNINNKAAILIAMIFVEFVILMLTIKKNVIDLVLIYQKYAPEKLRKSCLYEPSCSEYMILAIKK